MLIDGKWVDKWHPVEHTDEEGGFVRHVSSFRDWITPNGEAGPTGEGGYPAVPNRYHLYIAYTCPWACRTIMVRKLKKLDSLITFSAVEPGLTEQGWRFGRYPGADHDELNGVTYLHEIYSRADPHYSGRATVPVLWDRHRRTIVNNESTDIIRMLNGAFNAFADSHFELYPQSLRQEIDSINDLLYDKFNNGVYRAGFATTQRAYEKAVKEVFDTLDELEKRLDSKGYLAGNALTEADIRAFVTIVRFDVVYHGIFKCNLRRVADYPNIGKYMNRIYNLPGIKETVNFDHIKRGYYSIRDLNPNGIVPAGPIIDLNGAPVT